MERNRLTAVQMSRGTRNFELGRDEYPLSHYRTSNQRRVAKKAIRKKMRAWDKKLTRET